MPEPKGRAAGRRRGDARFAILEYIGFEGVIPEGNYGGGRKWLLEDVAPS